MFSVWRTNYFIWSLFYVFPQAIRIARASRLCHRVTPEALLLQSYPNAAEGIAKPAAQESSRLRLAPLPPEAVKIRILPGVALLGFHRNQGNVRLPLAVGCDHHWWRVSLG